MLRLSTPNNEKFIQADEFDINYGGGEAKRLRFPAQITDITLNSVTAVPDNEFGECAVASIRKYGVENPAISQDAANVPVSIISKRALR